jgi:hypothetical protein
LPQPRITALIDAFNQGCFIGQAIESALAQGLATGELEVLVVDDGSTDDTAARVARFGDRVRYVRKENGGQASALNLGLAESRGEIVALLDGDDLWLPGKLRRVTEAFEKNPHAGMVYHPFEYCDEQRNLTWKDAAFPAVSGHVPASLEALLQYGDVSTSGLAFRRWALPPLLPIPEELTILADGHLAYLAIFVAPVVALPDHLTRYRIHGSNLCAFGEGDRTRGERRAACSAAVAASVRRWLAARGLDAKPEVAAYIRRHELVAQMVRHMSCGAGRMEFFQHLWAQQQLYAPVWPARYRAFRKLGAALALLTGYRGYHALQRGWRRMARAIAPGRSVFSALGGSHAPELARWQARPIGT